MPKKTYIYKKSFAVLQQTIVRVAVRECAVPPHPIPYVVVQFVAV